MSLDDAIAAANRFNTHAEKCPICVDVMTPTVCEEGLKLLQDFYDVLKNGKNPPEST